MGVLTHSWTGTDGAVWDAASWDLYQDLGTPTAGRATIQANRGRLTTGAIGYASDVRGFFKAQSSLVDSEVYVEVVLDGSKVEQYFVVAIRADSAAGILGPNDGGQFPQNGYALEIAESTGAGQLRRVVNRTITILGASATVTAGGLTVSATYGVRLRADGGRIRWRAWNLAGSEPATWTQDYTDGSPYLTTGKTMLTVNNGNAATPRYFDFDNLTVDDLSLTGSATPSLTGTGALTASGVISLTVLGTAVLTGSGALTASGATTADHSAAAPMTGSGSLMALTGPAEAGGAALTGVGALTGTGEATISSPVTYRADQFMLFFG